MSIALKKDELAVKNTIKNGLYRIHFKRLLDIICSLVGLIVLSPVMVIIAILVRIKLGNPVIFKQKRPGLNEEIFIMYKFRTMSNKCDENGNLLSDGERLTKIGEFLRSTSLDELPELFNILKGDMSVVGPRPLLVQYLPLYNNHQKRRHEVRPGLTGLAQISGRNALSWGKKFNLDVEYVDNVSLFVDCKIISETIIKVLKREGINQDGEATMEYFVGSGNIK